LFVLAVDIKPNTFEDIGLGDISPHTWGRGPEATSDLKDGLELVIHPIDLEVIVVRVRLSDRG
jgi:hypothetical protein